MSEGGRGGRREDYEARESSCHTPVSRPLFQYKIGMELLTITTAEVGLVCIGTAVKCTHTHTKVVDVHTHVYIGC